MLGTSRAITGMYSEGVGPTRGNVRYHVLMPEYEYILAWIESCS